MYLVLGLGNPGRRYTRTRHNAGFLVADRLAARLGASLDRKPLGALVTSVRVGDERVVLAQPQSFMNLSGQPAASLKGYYKVATDKIIVVHDELDLDFGQVRVKRGGGHAGHNGLRDIQARAGGNGFSRVRVGISRPPPEWETADYVLSRWTTQEASALDEVVDRAADAVECVVRDGVVEAMNRFNTRPRANKRSASAPADASGIES